MVPKPNMMALPMMSCNKITVVKPLSAVPANFMYKVQTPSKSEEKKNNAPRMVMICKGNDENAEMAETKRRQSFMGDHLLVPSTRRATSNGMA